MRKIFSLLLFLITFTLFNSNSGAMPPPPRCEEYTYSNCPSYGCEKTCMPSTCSGNICTADCDGPGSCHLPIAKSCIKLGERFKFYTQNQFCCEGLTKVPGKDTKNIIPGYATCIKIDGYCDTRYENEYNSPKDCKKEETKIPKNCISWYDGCNVCSLVNGKALYCTKRACFAYNTPKCLKYKEDNCIKEYGIISNGVYKYNMPRCCSGLKSVKYNKYSQICVNINDGKCGKYENYNNSPKDCKKEETKIPENCISWIGSFGERCQKIGTKIYCTNIVFSKQTPKCLKYKAKNINCIKEYKTISNGVYPIGMMPKCCNGLKPIKYNNYNQICVNINDGKCGKYENYNNSPKDCKKEETKIPENCISWIGSFGERCQKIGTKIYCTNIVFSKQTPKCLKYKEDNNCVKEYGVISNGVYKYNIPKCCSGLKSVKYNKYSQICVNINDGKCGKYENYNNSPKDCKKEKIKIPENCTAVYNPVCGKDGKTYSNSCELEKSGVGLKYKGKCEIEKNKMKLSKFLKAQIDIVLKKFFIKLDAKYSSKSEKIKKLETIVKKLKMLKIIEPKYSEIVDYLIEKIKQKLEELN